MDLFPCQTSQVKVATAAPPEDKTLGPIVGYLVRSSVYGTGGYDTGPSFADNNIPAAEPSRSR